MRNIPIERVSESIANQPSIVDQIDGIFKDICFELSNLADDKRERPETRSDSGCEPWMDALRKRFWERQFELNDNAESFRIRMAVPSAAAAALRVIVLESGIEIRGGENALVRWVRLAEAVDLSSVAAILDRGYLVITGLKQVPQPAISGALRRVPRVQVIGALA